MGRAFAIAAVLAVAAAPAGGAAEAPPMTLPGDARAAGASADPGTWIVGATPAQATARLARRFHAGSGGDGEQRQERAGGQERASHQRVGRSSAG